MGRLIDADALKRVLVVEWNLHDSDEFANKDVWKALELAPTIHPEPPKMGKWVQNTTWEWRCSECGERTTETIMGKPRYEFCPMCGAYMGGEG